LPINLFQFQFGAYQVRICAPDRYRFLGVGVAPGDASSLGELSGVAADADGLSVADGEAAGVGLSDGVGDAVTSGVGVAFGLNTVGIGDGSAGVGVGEASGDSVVTACGCSAVPTPYSYTSLPQRITW
jgi:hypothetical protein